MTPVRETPVLIVGGGPVGLALAADLGWRGIECVLVEQTDGQIHTPKMNEVNVRTMEFCRRWGIAEQVMHCPFPDDHPMDAVFVTSLGGYELARMERPARKHQTPGALSPMNQQTCSQTWFDPILRQLAQSFSHVALRHRCRLESFQPKDDGVTAELRDLETGKGEKVKSRFLAACDGANSAIRQALGIKLIGSEVLSRPVHMFFRAPDLFGKLGLRPGTFFLTIDRGGLWSNVRIIDPKSGLWRLMVLDTPPDFDPNKIDCEAYLRRALGRHIDVEWAGVSVWTRRGVVAERYSRGPVHLLGDAVHQLSPTGALGMNTGIGDAVDLAWKLAAVLEGWGGESLLASYDAERRPIGERNVRLATGFFENHRLFEEGVDAIEDATPAGDEIRQRLGDQLMRDVARMFRTIGVQLGYRYDPSPICAPDGTPAPADEPEVYLPSACPGGRAPHVSLADGRSTLDLFGRGFVFLRIGAGAPAAPELAQAAARVRLPLDVVTLGEPEVLERYASRLVLVRPDGHVAWRGNALPADVEALIDRVRGAASQVNWSAHH
jgi:2-polyprenyl-6-methoxyphenol hydroxylase-like FAD-dependent oxidoreductase